MSIVGTIYDENVIYIPVIWADANSQPQKLRLGEYTRWGGEATGINSLGQIVGNIYLNETLTMSIPAYWNDFLSLPTLKPHDQSAVNLYWNDINDLGNIVGSIDIISDTSSLKSTPCFMSNSTAPIKRLSLGNLGTYGKAYGINSLGQIIGFIIIVGGKNIPVIWTDSNSQPQPLSLDARNVVGINKIVKYGYAKTINNLGQITGVIDRDNKTPDQYKQTELVIWNNSKDLPQKLSLKNRTIPYRVNGFNSLGQIIGNIVTFDIESLPLFWKDSNSQPQQLRLGNFTLDNVTYGRSLGIVDPPLPAPAPIISNICFPAGTPVTTDQGRVAIEAIDPKLHTIRQQPILHVTRTVTLDKYLVSFAPNALGRNVPHTQTLLSKDHKIVFEGQLVPAYRFLDFSDQVKKVTYKGETLYNVLLADYDTMLINNLECETLHPENIIAKLYTANYTDTERTSLVQEWNTTLTQRDNSAYQAVINRLTRKP